MNTIRTFAFAGIAAMLVPAAHAVTLTPGTWAARSTNNSASIGTNTSSEVSYSFDTGTYGTVYAALDQALTLDTVGDFLQVEYSLGGNVETNNSNRDYYLRTGFYDDQDTAGTTDDLGVFSAIGWNSGGNRDSAIFDHGAGAADLLSLGNDNPASGAGVTKIGGDDSDVYKNPEATGVFRIEYLAGGDLALTFTGTSGNGPALVSRTLLAADVPTYSFDELAMGIGFDNLGTTATATFSNIVVTTNAIEPVVEAGPAVPEPATFGLAALALLGLVRRR